MLRSLAVAGLDLLAAPVCAACGGSLLDAHGRHVTAALCQPCRIQLRSAEPIAWLLQPPAERIGAGCGGAIPAFAAAAYEGSWRTILLAYKERGRRELRTELASALVVACLAACLAAPITTLGSPLLLLVPIPSRRSTIRQRGHDAVRVLTDITARTLRELGWPVLTAPVLRHQRDVADQSGLNLRMRAANLDGALGVRRPNRVAGRSVIVVDDIVTTGATTGEAARVLATCGGQVHAIAAVAVTPRRWPASSAHLGDEYRQTDAAHLVTPG